MDVFVWEPFFLVHGSAISAGYWKEECLRWRLHNFLTSRVSVLSGLPSCSILVQEFQGFSLEHWVKEYVSLKGIQAGFFFLFHYIVFNFFIKEYEFWRACYDGCSGQIKGVLFCCVYFGWLPKGYSTCKYLFGFPSLNMQAMFSSVRKNKSKPLIQSRNKQE